MDMIAVERAMAGVLMCSPPLPEANAQYIALL
jgi:hypothetical protein